MRKNEQTFAYVDLFPGEAGPRISPMQAGGEGLHFVYLTNRNHCTFLFKPRPFDGALYALLSEKFPMGYAQLYILEKTSTSARHDEDPKRPFAVFQDPGWTNVGGGAVSEFHPDKHVAIQEMRERRDKEPVPLILVRLVDSATWH